MNDLQKMQSSSTPSPKLVMGQLAPTLAVNTLAGTVWTLAKQTPQSYTMIVFYRGLHCPICSQHIAELEHRLENFKHLGVNAIAISGDTEKKARQFYETAKLQHLNLGYGLTLQDMRRWGLYLSRGHFASEPDIFSEPALFLVKPDGYLYLANIGTHPFSRLNFDFLLEGVEYVISQDYPFRGNVFWFN